MAASVEGCDNAYREVLRMARRFALSEDEARDLVQDAIMIALARGFNDWSTPERRGWLRGVVPGGWSVEFKDPDGHPLAFFQEEALRRR